MSDLPLFYSSVVPLDSQAHRAHGVSTAADRFGFAARAHIIPAVAEEFAAAAREIPIVFAPAGTGHSAVFLCGLKAQSNLFISEGRWNGGYVPAYLRRLPFILGERPSGDPLICVDTAHAGFGVGEGVERLFDDEGKATPTLNATVKLVTEYAGAAKRTEQLCAKLQELGLLRSVTLDVKTPDGASASIHGIFIVDEAKLAAISEAALLELRRLNLIGAVYAHLFSLGAMQSLAGRMKDADTVKTAA